MTVASLWFSLIGFITGDSVVNTLWWITQRSWSQKSQRLCQRCFPPFMKDLLLWDLYITWMRLCSCHVIWRNIWWAAFNGSTGIKDKFNAFGCLSFPGLSSHLHVFITLIQTLNNEVNGSLLTGRAETNHFTCKEIHTGTEELQSVHLENDFQGFQQMCWSLQFSFSLL